MASPTLSQFAGITSHWKQWRRRSPNFCCSKKILLLLMWHVLFIFSWSVLYYSTASILSNDIIYYTSTFLSCFSAPFVGWLADVRFGRYEVLKFGSIISFLVSVLCYVAFFFEYKSTVNTLLLGVVLILASFSYSCYEAAMLPFLSDQIIGATSDELSAVVRWYYWTLYLAGTLSFVVVEEQYYHADQVNVLASNIVISSTVLIFSVPLAVIIISDCLCQQWLDRTHKVTNPIKLIIQVLNYTRKHRYPERRSAFTYSDEEQPTRMDYGKEKFGGPFTEEVVEDVKTVLRLIPLVMSLSLSISAFEYYISTVDLFYNFESFNNKQ